MGLWLKDKYGYDSEQVGTVSLVVGAGELLGNLLVAKYADGM
jgi:predicted MFS family arabinose efflux permease